MLQFRISAIYRGDTAMSAEENKAIIRRWFEEYWNANTPDVADELIHPDYPNAEGSSGAEGYKQGLAFWRRVLPDQQFTLDEVIAEGDTVIVRWTSIGTHHGDWATPIGTVPATGKLTTVPGTSTYHLRDGKIIQDWNHIDFLGMLQQLGAVVQPGEPRAPVKYCAI